MAAPRSSGSSQRATSRSSRRRPRSPTASSPTHAPTSPSPARGLTDDPAGALQLAYDACRKASAALLAVQGLRGTARGGHVAVIDAVRAQFNDSGGVEVFGRLHQLRRRRNRTEYPDVDSPTIIGDQR